MTAIPCGMKKSSAASSHSTSELGPAFADVATQRSPSTATTLNSTRSPSRRTRLRSWVPLGLDLASSCMTGPIWCPRVTAS